MAAIAAHRRLRLALTVLWASGALLAVGAALAAVAVGHAAGAVSYAVPAALLVVLGTATAYGSRIALVTGLVLCGVQPLAVVATAWELTHDVPAGQAAKVRSLGIDPTVGVAINFCFAAWASLLALWAYHVARKRAGHRAGLGRNARSSQTPELQELPGSPDRCPARSETAFAAP